MYIQINYQYKNEASQYIHEQYDDLFNLYIQKPLQKQN